MGYFQAKAAKSVMISDMEKLLMLRIGAWLSANKNLAPRGVVIEGALKAWPESKLGVLDVAGYHRKPWKCQ